MILFLFISILIHNTSSFGQELPQITPPSPTAFEITKYGDIPINESSGRVAKNIPLYNYTAGKLQLPLSISYTGNGVKVDQLATWTGINWSLNAGGVITRIVKDLPDECTTNRLFYNWQDLNDLNLPSNQANVDLMQNISQGGNYDTEVDIFNFSFAGYSGSFYLDENMLPVQIKHQSELKIELINWTTAGYQDDQTITIKTPDGVIYYFGSDQASEQTRTDDESTFSPTTAYYLYQITHPFGDSIFIEYNTVAIEHSLRLSQYQSESYEYSTEGNNCTSLNNSPINDFVNNTVYNGRFISKITSNRTNVKINFNSDFISNNIHYNRILNNIIIEDNIHSANNKRVDFSYLYPNTNNNSSRFFLEKIEFKNYLNAKNYAYSFEYNDPLGLPERMDYAQDYIGYYNGKNNGSLLPRNQSNDYFLGSTYADREPSFQNAIKGTLSKINYPTGGYTQIEYEAPEIMVPKIENLFLETFCSQSNLIPDTDLDDSLIINYFDENMQQIGVYEDQTISINLDVTASGYINHHYIIYVKVTNLNTNEIVERSMVLSPDVYIYNSVFDFDLKEGDGYKIELLLDPDSSSTSTPSPVFVNASFAYISGVNPVNWVGIRVKKTLDYTRDNTTPIIKRYYYKNPIGGFVPNFITHNQIVTCDVIDQCFHKIIKLNSSSLGSYYTSTSNLSIYKNVSISYGGDNFENGGVEKQFKATGLGIYNIYPSNEENIFTSHLAEGHKSNRAIFDGQLEKEYVYKNDGGSLFMVNSTIYQYAHETLNTIPNLFIHKLYDFCGAVDHNIDNLHIVLYSIHGYNDNLVSQASTNYVDPVPIEDIENSIFYDQITATKTYEYNSFIGLPTKITTSLSNSDLILETKNYYVDQVDSLDWLDAAHINAYSTLRAMHRLTDPIQVETYQTETGGNNSPKLLSSKRTIYRNWNSGGLVLPEFIQTAKEYDISNNTFENRIVFHDYSNYGNLLEVSKANGPHTVYIWGYDHQYPVAKIEDVTYSQIEGLNYFSNGFNLGSNGLSSDQESSLRALSNSQVTSYSYYPLVGVTSITDPSGYTSNYEYDEFNRLLYIKNKDDKVVEEYNYNYAIPYDDLEFVNIGNNIPTSVLVGESVNFEAILTGGSGDFGYEWTVVNDTYTNTYTSSTNTTSVDTHNFSLPNFSMTCEVTDYQTLENVTYSDQVELAQSNPALAVDPIITIPAGSLRKAVGQTVTYSITVTNGSGNYQYEWSKTNGQNTSVIGSGSNTVTNTVTLSDCGGFTISCKVTDINSGEIITKTMNLWVFCGGMEI